MPLILCIETATKLCSVALGRDGHVLATRDLESAQHVHAEKVNVFIEELILEAGVALNELNAVAVGIGPGSYTGLRIGLSTAKGLCYALGIPILGIGTLYTLVHAARAQRPVLPSDQWPMVDARRMEVFSQCFDSDGHAVTSAAPLILDETWATAHAPIQVFGDGADKAAGLWNTVPDILHIHGVRPYAAAMMALAEARFADGAFDDVAYLVPTYGKAANVTLPKARIGG